MRGRMMRMAGLWGLGWVGLITAAIAAPEWQGFADFRAGVRTQPDDHAPDAILGESRFQIWGEHREEWGTLTLRSDFLYDAIPRHSSLDLETGHGPVDLREANVLFSPAADMDVKVGRQILTWGVGDLLFINDLFPKDWNSFFCGRDTDYLKAPSDAALMSFYSGALNVDVVYTPRFDPDRFIDGDRISYWSPADGRRAGRDRIVDPDRPEEWFQQDEWAGRLRGTGMGLEWAVYAYDGYWKSPEGFDPMVGRPCFPRLSVYGASARGPIGGGLFSVETGYYDSRDDREGTDPMTPNDQQRFLAGYEWEAARNFQVALQYYAEILLDYDGYRSMLPSGQSARDEVRQVATLRLTRLLMNQNLILSLFTFYSPTDADGYCRPSLAYQVDDRWRLMGGANLFWGREDHTFFGQFDDNNNVYAAIRYAF